MIKIPLPVTEHVRGLEQKANFVLAGGCDILHVDPEFDMGVTECMKIAHLAGALGIDLQIHAAGPAQRSCMSAIRNTRFYELALDGPGMPDAVPPVYACGYSDQLEDIVEDGCFPVPRGPGLVACSMIGFLLYAIGHGNMSLNQTRGNILPGSFFRRGKCRSTISQVVI